jgi:HEAT repeat protein
LLTALADPSPRQRAGAAHAVGSLKLAAGLEPLMNLLQDTAPQARTQAAWALGRLARPQAAASLVAALGDGEAGVRRHAGLSLLELDTAAVLDPLIAALHHPSWRVRAGAADLLPRTNDSRALEAVGARRQQLTGLAADFGHAVSQGGSDDDLIDALGLAGNMKMAQACLASGREPLMQAASEWMTQRPDAAGTTPLTTASRWRSP